MKEDLDEALEALRSALAIQDEVLGNHEETERSHREIAYVLRSQKRGFTGSTGVHVCF